MNFDLETLIEIKKSAGVAILNLYLLIGFVSIRRAITQNTTLKK